MTFELLETTKAKLLDVVVLSQKNRQPDENPGAKLTLEIALPNHMLASFDGYLKGMLFQKAPGAPKAGQSTLEGVEAVSDLPCLSGIGSHIGALRWAQELTGYTLVVDLGLGTKRSNLEIEGCKLDGWKITPKEGGTVIVKVNVESADVSEASFGKLAKLKSREISMTLAGPEVAEEAQQEIDDKPKGRRSKKNWPFPKDGAKTDAELAQH